MHYRVFVSGFRHNKNNNLNYFELEKCYRKQENNREYIHWAHILIFINGDRTIHISVPSVYV